MRLATSSQSIGGNRPEWLRFSGLLAMILLLHVVAWGTLLLWVVPGHYMVGTEAFGVGLGATAYTLGLRHAFDADHIAAIDNTTRKLMADGKRPVSAGFWFALGHSSVVVILAVLIVTGSQLVSTLSSDGSTAHEALALAGTSISGLFLVLIAILNLAALVGILRMWRAMRHGEFDEAALEAQLNARGVMNRLLGRLTRSVSRPGQMYPIGFLFGIGFNTATEVTLLVLAGSGAAGNLPWYAILCIPLLFAAGMTLLDTLDGTFMNFAYHWAFANPVRKVYYNIIITGLSVAVALIIGGIELGTVVHNNLNLSDPLSAWIASLDLNNVGFVIVGLFVAVWFVAIAYWKLARVEDRWNPAASDKTSP
jgi:nickel/cobalt transporter (NiCoT) family protein